MTQIEEQLRSSVGCVLSSNDPAIFSGNAFLFRNDGACQYWFTCHHVIMSLPELFIRIERHGEPAISSASYVRERSWPERDIAVLKTSEINWKDLRALNMGDPFSAKQTISLDSQILLFGYIMNKEAKRIEPRSITSSFSRHDHDSYYLSKVQHDVGSLKQNDKEARVREWHILIEEPVDIAMYELHSGHHLSSGLSGSPACYFTLDGDIVCLGMLSQIWRGPLRDPQKGVTIKFVDLLEAAGALIPLYPYADCLVVTVAATRDEIAHARQSYKMSEEEEKWWPFMAQEHFYGNHRDYWRPFGAGEDTDPRVVDLIYRSQIPDACQLISDYLAEADEILRAVTNFSGVLFILDPCSTNIESMKKIIDIANKMNWKAAYLTLCCEQRLAHRWLPTKIASTVKDKLREATYFPKCEERMESAWAVEDFERHVRRLVKVTVDMGVAAWEINSSVQPRRRLSNQLGMVNAFPQAKPTL
jgi:hypothetical protein